MSGSSGGIYNSGNLTLTHVAILWNTAPVGGGIFNEGNLGLYGVFISGNSATSGSGGGLFNGKPAISRQPPAKRTARLSRLCPAAGTALT